MELFSGIRRYEAIDLLIWGAVVCILEGLVVTVGLGLFPSQPYVVSVVPAVVAIVYMRWGVPGIAHAMAGGFVLCASSHAGIGSYVVYMVGNLLSVLSLVLLKGLGRRKVRDGAFLSAAFAASVALSMQLGRGFVAVLLGGGLGGVVDFVSTDVLSGVFAVVVVCIARRLDGVFEYQRDYLLRTAVDEKGVGDEGDGLSCP